MKARKTIPVKVRIGQIHVMNGGSDDYACLEIDDGENGIRLLKIDLSHTQLGLLLLNKQVAAQAELGWFDMIGKKNERKSEFVAMHQWENGVEGRVLTGDEMVSPFEVDGWARDRTPKTPIHMFQEYDGVKGVYVSFSRWVDAETGEPVP